MIDPFFNGVCCGVSIAFAAVIAIWLFVVPLIKLLLIRK